MTEERPLASIGITTFNRAKIIGRCIDSVLNQTYRPIEVVVADDGSTDDTRRVLESYGSAIQAVYNGQNRGMAAAKNRALTATSPSARYVGLLDSDDYFHPRFVERCVEFLQNAPEIGLVYADDILVDTRGCEVKKRIAVEPWSIETWLRTCNLRSDIWLARRELVMKTSLHDESLELDEDYDLFYQLLEITTFAHLPEFLVYITDNPEHTHRYWVELAKCHAANLVKYGYSPEYAYLRARRHPEWVSAIEEGVALGKTLRAHREGRLHTNQ